MSTVKKEKNAQVENFYSTGLKLLIKHKGLTQVAVSKITGIGQGRLSEYVRGTTRPTLENKIKLGKALDFGTTEEYEEAARALLAGEDVPPQKDTIAHILTDEEMEQRGFIAVPYSEKMELAAGVGGSCIPVEQDEFTSKIVVHGPSLGHHNAKNLQAFHVTGDSMEPVIAEDGIVLADTQFKDIMHIKDRRIYVCCYDLEGGSCSVKYLRWIEKKKWLAIESANTFYEPVFKRPEEVVLIGKVIWSWRRHED